MKEPKDGETIASSSSSSLSSEVGELETRESRLQVEKWLRGLGWNEGSNSECWSRVLSAGEAGNSMGEGSGRVEVKLHANRGAGVM